MSTYTCPHTYVHIHILMGHSRHLSLSLLCFIFASGWLPSFPLLSCYMQSAPSPISQFPLHNPFLSCPFLLCLAFSKQWKQWGEMLGLNIAPIIAAKWTELTPWFKLELRSPQKWRNPSFPQICFSFKVKYLLGIVQISMSLKIKNCNGKSAWFAPCLPKLHRSSSRGVLSELELSAL